jgi:hypothetical protein
MEGTPLVAVKHEHRAIYVNKYKWILRKIGKTVYPLPLQGAGIKILACEFQL